MKRIFITGWFLFFILLGSAQITLQKTYNYSISVVNLETLGYKYYLMDIPASQCRIYNMDHSLFKTISCPVPSGYYLADIKYVSEKLFNPDAQIELAYTYYKYVATATSYYYIYGAKVVNESGSNLLSIDGAQYIYVNKTGDAEYKLFAYCYDYSVSPEKVWTNLYNLPGILSTSMIVSGTPSDVLLKAYPNPATDQIQIAYELPANVKSARLYLLDSMGRMVKNYSIDDHSDHLALNVGQLSAGVYNYYIEYDHLRSISKKLVVQ